MNPLLELADRVEAATADEQYQLLSEAFEAVHGPISTTKGPIVHFNRAWFPFKKLLAAGAFLDAALTLRPEESDGYGIYPNAAEIILNGAIHECRLSATPALALCAAALRARASIQETGNG